MNKMPSMFKLIMKGMIGLTLDIFLIVLMMTKYNMTFIESILILAIAGIPFYIIYYNFRYKKRFVKYFFGNKNDK